MSFNRFRALTWFILCIVSFLSCRRDDFGKLSTGNWDPEYAVPLIDSRFGIDRVLRKYEESGVLTTDEDNVVVFVYRGRIFEIAAKDVIKLNSATFDLALVQGNLPLVTGTMGLQHILLGDGVMKVHAEHMVTEDVEVTLSMPGSTKDAVPFEETFVVKYQGSSPSRFDTIYDLTGYHLDLTGSDGQQRNNIFIEYTARTSGNHAPVVLTKCELQFEQLGYTFLDGYLGKINLGLYSDSIELTVFDRFKSGTILLEDPKFQIEIRNGFGIPILTTIGNFTGRGDGGTSNLSGPGVSNGIEVKSPGSPSAKPVVTVTEFNSNNSNVTNFLSVSPKTVNFNFQLEANAKNDVNAYNFAYDTSRITGDLHLEIPLKGSVDSVILEDDYDFISQDLKNIKVALFKIHTVNSFPLGIYFQLYFLDAAGHKMDSLILDNTAILREAYTDINGFSIKPAIEESQVAIGDLRFSNIADRASKMRISAMLLSSESDKKRIRITADNYFHIKIGVRAVITYKP